MSMDINKYIEFTSSAARAALVFWKGLRPEQTAYSRTFKSWLLCHSQHEHYLYPVYFVCIFHVCMYIP